MWYIFLTLDIKGINDTTLISKPIHAPSREVQDTDTNTSLIKVVNKRILVELLSIREESKGKVKGKILPRTGHKGPEGEQMYSSTLLSTLVLDGGGWLTPRPSRFIPGKDPVPIV